MGTEGSIYVHFPSIIYNASRMNISNGHPVSSLISACLKTLDDSPSSLESHLNYFTGHKDQWNESECFLKQCLRFCLHHPLYQLTILNLPFVSHVSHFIIFVFVCWSFHACFPYCVRNSQFTQLSHGQTFSTICVPLNDMSLKVRWLETISSV